MKLSVMFDIETLGTTTDSVILSLGAVKFDPYSSEEPRDPKYFLLDIDQQVGAGRIIEDSTLEWWGKQSDEARDSAFTEEGRTDILDFIKQFNKYIVGSDNVFSQGCFDIVLIENLLKQWLTPPPWRYWQIRDSRTILDMGDDSAKTSNQAAHNALADAYCQALAVQQVYKALGVKRK